MGLLDILQFDDMCTFAKCCGSYEISVPKYFIGIYPYDNYLQITYRGRIASDPNNRTREYIKFPYDLRFYLGYCLEEITVDYILEYIEASQKRSYDPKLLTDYFREVWEKETGHYEQQRINEHISSFCYRTEQEKKDKQTILQLYLLSKKKKIIIDAERGMYKQI